MKRNKNHKDPLHFVLLMYWCLHENCVELIDSFVNSVTAALDNIWISNHFDPLQIHLRDYPSEANRASETELMNDSMTINTQRESYDRGSEPLWGAAWLIWDAQRSENTWHVNLMSCWAVIESCTYHCVPTQGEQEVDFYWFVLRFKSNNSA